MSDEPKKKVTREEQLAAEGVHPGYMMSPAAPLMSEDEMFDSLSDEAKKVLTREQYVAGIGQLWMSIQGAYGELYGLIEARHEPDNAELQQMRRQATDMFGLLAVEMHAFNSISETGTVSQEDRLQLVGYLRATLDMATLLKKRLQ